jgi:predicted metalloprotease with PDZ domain
VGRSIRKASKKEFDTFLTGTWPFKDSVATKAGSRVLEKCLELTGFALPARPVLMIAPLPVSTGATKWRAQTRGSTVLVLMDPQASITNWKGQLEIIFSHEVLHLWVPNSLQLRGDYDWFFEGFTLYTALLTALDLKAIDFREYLDTLARVYDSYISYPNVLSLIEASERRWTHPWPVVYDKGMLVAFLYDLVLRKGSGGKTTLASRYRELFSAGAADRADGNDVIISLLSSTPEAADLARDYISGKKDLELDRYLVSYGLILDTSGKTSRLIVGNKVDGDQKRLLKSLGY